MTVWTVISFVIGLVCLVVGAELLVRGAATLATRLGIAPVVVGLTVVAFGTSAPELAVSVGATLDDNPGIALGNVVGSNIANVLFILGGAAVVGGLVVAQRIIRIDIPLVIVVSIVTLVMALDESIGRIDGLILFGTLIVYVAWMVRAAVKGRGSDPAEAEFEESLEQLEGKLAQAGALVQIGLVVVGLAILVLGSQLLVGSATTVAEELGVSDLVIGLTVVAIGTSLPELATSMLAAFRGQRDIAVGNVVGSNLFNLMCVLGLTGIISGGVDVAEGALTLDMPVMIVSAIVLVPMVMRGGIIERWEGFVLLAAYATYLAYLVADATDHGSKDLIGPAAVISVPLVLITLVVLALRGRRIRTEDSAAA